MCQTVGQRLRELRKLRGYSQLQLGRLLFEGENVNENAKQLRISRLEASDVINVETRGRLAKVLGVSPTELLPKEAGQQEKEEGIKTKIIEFDQRLLDLTPSMEQRLRALNSLTAFGQQLPILAAHALKSIVEEIKETHGLKGIADCGEKSPGRPAVIKSERYSSK